MRRTWARTLAGFVATVLGVACQVDIVPLPDAGGGCTLIGCTSQVVFALAGVDLVADARYDVEVCVEDDCERRTVDVGATGFAAVAGGIGLDADRDTVSRELFTDGPLEGARRYALTVRDEHGQVVVASQGETPFERSQPNGPDCAPVCWQARLEV